MSIIQHSKRFQGRADELRATKKENRYKGIIALIVSVLIVIVLFVNLTFTIPFVEETEGILFIMFFFLSLFGTGRVYEPLGEYNRAFLNIVESIEIIEKKGTTSKSYNEASKKILHAYSSLVQKPRKPWLTETKKTEQEFFRNLKFRVSPAIKDNKLNSGDLADIIRAMESTNIDLLKQVNEQLTAQYEEKEIIERNIQTFVTSFLNTFLGKIIFSSAISFSIIFVLTYAGVSVFELEFRNTIQSNLFTVIAVFITSTIAILNIIKDREFFK